MGGREVLIFFMLLASFAYAVTPNEGLAFVNETVPTMCAGADVQAVYICSGYAVKVVSALPGAGSTFYTPEGKTIYCPVVPPSQLGAECMYMLTPNFCTVQAECGNVSAPQVFPGQSGSPEQTGNESYYVNESAAASPPPEEPELNVTPEQPAQQRVAQSVPEADVPAPAPSNFEFSMDNLVLVLFGLGAVAVVILFMMFRNSISELE